MSTTTTRPPTDDGATAGPARAPSLVDHATAGGETSTAATALAVLRNRDFRLLAAGQSLSSLGDAFFVVTMPFLVLAGGGGAGQLSTVLAVFGVTRLVGAGIGGPLTDHLGPRTCMLSADAGRTAVVLTLAGWMAVSGSTPGVSVLSAVTATLGLLEGVYLPAYRAMTPSLLDDDQLATGNSVGETLNLLAWIAGGALAGAALVTLEAPAVLAVDAVTFAASALSLALMRRRGSRTVTVAEQDSERSGGGLDAAASAATSIPQFVRQSSIFRTLLAMVAMASITTGGLLSVALPLLAAEQFDGSAAYGALIACEGVGMLVGGVVAMALGHSRRRGPVVLGLVAGQGVVLIALPQTGSLVVAAVAMVLVGATNGVLGVLLMTILQLLPPRRLLGRAMSLVSIVSAGAYPLSALVIGLLAVAHGNGAPFVVGGLGLLLVSAAAAAQRRVRSL